MSVWIRLCNHTCIQHASNVRQSTQAGRYGGRLLQHRPDVTGVPEVGLSP